jgi:hypothetical protein
LSISQVEGSYSGPSQPSGLLQAGKHVVEGLDPAAVLRGSGALAGHAQGVMDALASRSGLLDADVHLPSLADVVLVHHPIPVRQVQVAERDIAVVLDVQLIPLDRVSELQVIECEGMGLVVKPVEGDLDRVMEPGEPHRLPDEQAPPDPGLRADDHHAQAQHARGGLLRPLPFALL